MPSEVCGWQRTSHARRRRFVARLNLDVRAAYVCFWPEADIVTLGDFCSAVCRRPRGLEGA